MINNDYIIGTFRFSWTKPEDWRSSEQTVRYAYSLSIYTYQCALLYIIYYKCYRYHIHHTHTYHMCMYVSTHLYIYIIIRVYTVYIHIISYYDFHPSRFVQIPKSQFDLFRAATGGNEKRAIFLHGSPFVAIRATVAPAIDLAVDQAKDRRRWKKGGGKKAVRRGSPLVNRRN
jgi:hypothetical protein